MSVSVIGGASASQAGLAQRGTRPGLDLRGEKYLPEQATASQGPLALSRVSQSGGHLSPSGGLWLCGSCW